MSIGLGDLQDKLDANQTIFFSRELESIESRLYEIKLTELKYRTYIPVSNRDNPGVETITYRMMTKVGMAIVISDYADDIPRADVFGEEFTQKVRSVGASIGFSMQEVRAASFANKSLDTAKADSARRAVREKESDIAWNGDAEFGLIGLLDNDNIPFIATPTGTGGFLWSQKTPDEILNDLRLMTSGIREQSKGIHNGNTLLLPIEQYDIIAQTPRSSTSDLTILEFVTKPGNSFGLATIDWLPTELKDRFIGDTKDGALMYERDPEVLEQRIPMELITYPIEVRGLENIINMEARNGGVVLRYPLATTIMTGI